MRCVKIKGTPPQDWVNEAEAVTQRLHAADKLTIEETTSQLQLLPDLKNEGDMPAAGTLLLAIGQLKGLLRIRCFDAAGSTVADVRESKKEPDHSPIHDMRKLLGGNWDVSRLKPFEKAELFRIATLVIRRAAVEVIIAEKEKLWNDDRIRNWLLGQFNNKCWYSEAQDSVSSIHVDHYRPKGRMSDDTDGPTSDGYWWLAFKYANYKMCGQLLNVKKRDVFPHGDTTRGTPDDPDSLALESPVLIDPCTHDARLISFEVQDEETCVAVVAGGITADQAKRADRTIDILGLNRLPRLNSKRAEFWNDCMMEIATYRGATGPKCLQLVAQSGVKLKLQQRVDYNKEFSSVVEACIRKMAPEPLAAAVFGDD